MEPSFYDDLDGTLAESWRLIARGVADRRSPFHHPTVATIGQDGRPRARTVILRACEPSVRALRFHTDARSAKIEEIGRDGRAALHFYDPQAKIQIRVEGVASIHAADAVAEAAWAGSRVFSRQCYGVSPGPGAPIDSGGGFTLPETTDEATASGRAHFRAIVVRASSLEWLYLSHAGHRRAHFAWNGEGAWTARWLTP
jgi:pyridoxamine 5'-phosphate oxidase